MSSGQRARTPLMPTVFSAKFVFEKSENKQKEAEIGAFLKPFALTNPAALSWPRICARIPVIMSIVDEEIWLILQKDRSLPSARDFCQAGTDQAVFRFRLRR